MVVGHRLWEEKLKNNYNFFFSSPLVKLYEIGWWSQATEDSTGFKIVLLSR